MGKIFFSHRMDALADRLAEELERAAASPLQNQIVLVPNRSVKQWLSLELAKRKGISMGLKFLQADEGLLGSRLAPNALELFFLIYGALKECGDPDLLSYAEGKEKRLEELAGQLSHLFFAYGQWGSSLFDPHRDPIDWQHAILQKLFVQGPWRAPVQSEKFEGAHRSPIHCFGVDVLPPVYWECLFRKFSPSVYLFSPSVHYWEDVCTDREKKNLRRFWKKKGASEGKLNELEAFLDDAPPLLAQWGKAGRETLKNLGLFEPQTEEAYPPLEPESLLKNIQSDLLLFQKEEEPKAIPAKDDSMEILLTGSSRLREVEALRDAILHLTSQKGIAPHEISVLAPDIKPYAPLIELVFSEAGCPYRIFGVDLRLQSSFAQGLSRLTALIGGTWEREEALSLFETPAFYRKQKWEPETLDRFRDWISQARIQWGADAAHRAAVLKETLGVAPSAERGSWEQGFASLLDQAVFLFPQTPLSRKREVDIDELEKLFSLFTGLKGRLSAFQGEKTLGSWAALLESLAEDYLFADSADEADAAALRDFRLLLNDLRQGGLRLEHRLFPFAPLRRFLIRPCLGQIHSSLLHAVRFAPIEEGASIPAKALFLIGMDETHFPRTRTGSSLDLLRRTGEARKMLEPTDRARYLFLQCLFSAQEFLRISYGHLTPDEGKRLNPSSIVQEFLSYLDAAFSIAGEKASAALSTVLPSLPFDARCFSEEKFRSYSKANFQLAQALYGPKRDLAVWPDPRPESALPEGEITIPIADLKALARHPWKFYLQKTEGIFLSEELEESFSLQKSRWLRASLQQEIEEILAEELPPGVFGEALKMEVLEKEAEWKRRLADWNAGSLFSLAFLENCRDRRWAEGRLELPPVELAWEGRLKVRLIGEIPLVSEEGLVAVYEDQVGGLLKIWPEALLAAIALQKPQILSLKSGKIRVFSEPEQSLKMFVEYYFRALSSPSPLLPEWGDAFLRKGREELAKKREATLTGRALFDDPVAEWIALRTQVPSAEKMIEGWGALLKETFSDLVASRNKTGEGHATV